MYEVKTRRDGGFWPELHGLGRSIWVRLERPAN